MTRTSMTAPLTSVGLADLLRSLATLEPSARLDPARWDAHARVLGIERAIAPSPVAKPPAARLPQPPDATTDTAARPPIAPRDIPPVPFWRAVEFDLRPDETERKRASTEHERRPLTEAELAPPASPPNFQSPPIELWSRLWPRLAGHLATVHASSVPDTPALVDILARALPLTRIPRRRLRAWADRAVLIHDRDPAQQWLLPDQAWLGRKLRQVMGARGIEVRLLSAGPSGLAYDPRRGRESDWPQAAPDTPALVAGEFARDSASRLAGGAPLSAREHAWRALGQRLARRGYRPAALVARPAAQAMRGLSRSWAVMPWERHSWLSSVTEAERKQRAHRLLALAAPALAVPAALLRALRWLLPGDWADLGTEADVWAHPDVAPTVYGFRFKPERAQDWLQRFADLPPDLQAEAWRLIRRYQQRYGREVQHFSIWRLFGQADLALERVLSARERIEAIAVAERLAASAGDSSAPLQAELRAWFRHLSPLLPDAAYEDEHVGAGLTRMWLESHDAGDAAPPSIDPWQRPPAGGGKKREVTLVHRHGGIWLSGPGSPIATLPVRGDAVWCDGRFVPVEGSSDSPPEPVGAIVGTRAIELRTELARVRLEPFTQPAAEPDAATAIGRDRHGLWTAYDIAGVTFRMRWIPPGRFVMGSPGEGSPGEGSPGEPGRFDDEGPQHEVVLTRGFWLAETPCTQALWSAVMGDNPSRFQSPERPVEQVSYNDVQRFLEQLNRQTSNDLPFRLPTEAEWEYACRAGTTGATYAGPIDIRGPDIEGSNDAPILDDIAWYGGNSGEDYELDDGYDSSDWPQKQYEHTKAGSHPVGRKRCNPWGLYDMLGNVYEWCDDEMRSYQHELVRDPYERTYERASRVVRGGSWLDFARLVRAASRDAYLPTYALGYLGFRVARGQAAPAEPAERA